MVLAAQERWPPLHAVVFRHFYDARAMPAARRSVKVAVGVSPGAADRTDLTGDAKFPCRERGLIDARALRWQLRRPRRDRKSTRLNSSHSSISYAVFCLK